MHLLRLSEVEIDVNDRVFRHAACGRCSVAGRVLRDAVMFFSAVTGQNEAWVHLWAGIVVVSPVFLRFVTPRFHPSNWLVRANETGLFAQYRSYLNYQLPADELGRFHLLRRDRGGASHPRACADARSGAPWRTQTQFLRYIELELAGDTASLASALQLEMSAKPLMRSTVRERSTLYRDYPLTMGTPPFLRIRWTWCPARRVPCLLAAIHQNRRPGVLKQDFTRLQSLSHEEQQKQLRDLAVRGEVIAAIYIARKLYGFSMPQAKMMVIG